jgi:hypothetical protein
MENEMMAEIDRLGYECDEWKARAEAAEAEAAQLRAQLAEGEWRPETDDDWPDRIIRAEMMVWERQANGIFAGILATERNVWRPAPPQEAA